MSGGRDEELAARVEDLLAAHGDAGRVVGIRRLSGGASRETWAVDVDGGAHQAGLILQTLRPGTVGGGPGMQGEAALMRAAAEVGVPVPAVVADDDGTVLGAPGILTARLEGETIARKLLRDDEWATARARLVGQAAAALAAIHRIDPGVAPTLRGGDQLEQLVQMLDGFDQPLPAFELAIRWLADHRPEQPRTTVVHGDFRLGNLLVDHEGLAGVLDWELAHLGDPVEDLGWYCVRAWRFGSALPAGGMGTREELLDAYEAAGGGRVDPEALRWWELLGTVKWGLICVLQAQVHLSGASRSVELATIGRRVCENEWDVLGLLPGGALPGPEPAAGQAGPDLYGRPTAAELLEAVREWVEGDVREATSGRVAFHARVAANARAMLERQVALGPAHEAAHRARLESLGHPDDASLARAIRAGEEDHRLEEVRAVVAASVRSKLEVANPRWLEPDR
ncbi:MAG TPA: phosphotransferase family protein [Acidimicrobiales bacterium]|nr:phosphotransferase family protein [Acidimicrobiales bacterium]